MLRIVTSVVLIGCVLSALGCSAAPDRRRVQAGLNEYVLASTPRLAAAPAPDGDVRTDVATDSAWLALRPRVAADPARREATPADEAPAGASGFVRWPSRRGPAYPGDFWTSFGRDAKEMPATVWDDTKATFTNPASLIGLGAAVAAGVVLDVTNSNGCTADHYSKKGSQLPKCWEQVGDIGGNPGVHFALAGAMYFTTLARNDTKNYEVSKTLLNALAINGLTTMALKGVAHSDSPNGDPFGWPSGHTSSTFCLATVMHEAYGPWVGVPLFVFAGFVGYERIDARNHDFSDVISGAIIGIAIGHAVMQNHRPKVFGFEVIPYVNPATGTTGLALTKRF